MYIYIYIQSWLKPLVFVTESVPLHPRYPRHIGHRDEREAPCRAPKAGPEPAEGLREATFQADACDWTRPFTSTLQPQNGS